MTIRRIKSGMWAAALAACLLLATTAAAQMKGPLPVGAAAEWEIPDNMQPADGPSFEWRIRDGSFIPMTALTGVTCAGVTCRATLTASNLDALNRAGTHSVTLSAFRADVGDSVQSAPFVLTSPAHAPRALRLVPK